MSEVILKCGRTSKLIIGDPMYLENIANGTDKGCEKDITFIRKRMPTCTETNIVIREVEDSFTIEDEVHPFTSIVVNIIICPTAYDDTTKEKLIEVFKNGQYHPKLLKKKGELGCDTARFTIETDFGYEEFHTGADGYYGYYMSYTNGKIFHIELSLDTELFDFDEIVKTMKHLFGEK